MDFKLQEVEKMKFNVCDWVEDADELSVLDTINIRENKLFDTAIFNLIRELEKKYRKEIILVPVTDRKFYSHAYPDGNIVTTEEDRSRWNEPDYNPKNTIEVVLKYITADAGVFAVAMSRTTRAFSDFECTDFDLRK